MHNSRDEIIYIGKAVSLKNRVRQYFQSSRNKTAKIEQMVSHNRFYYKNFDLTVSASFVLDQTVQEQPFYNPCLLYTSIVIMLTFSRNMR